MSEEYNPQYDNSYDNRIAFSRQQRPFQNNARILLGEGSRQETFARQIQNQIEEKERQKKNEKQAQWDYERQIQNQEVVYLQQSKRLGVLADNIYEQKQYQNNQNFQPQQNPINQSFTNQQINDANNIKRNQSFLNGQRSEFLRNHNSGKERRSEVNNEPNNAQGGIFADVYVQRDRQADLKKQQKQSHYEEIQRQIEEKKRKKEEETRLKQEEDIRYEEQIKKDMEELRQRYLKEEEKKNQVSKNQAIQEQSRVDQQNKEADRILKSKRRQNQIGFREFETSHPQGATENNIIETTKEIQVEGINDQTIPLDNTTQQNILPNFLQESIDEQYKEQNYSIRSYNRADIDHSNYHKQETNEQRNQQNYQINYQPNKENLTLDKYSKQYEELLYLNRMKQREQEDDLNRVRFDFEQQINILNNELNHLKAQEQISVESKQQAFFELANLHDHLKRQEIRENQKLAQAKQLIFQRQQPYNIQQNLPVTVAKKVLPSSIKFDRKLDNEDEGYFVTLNSGARMMGIPSIVENKIQGKLNVFEDSTQFQSGSTEIQEQIIQF